MFKTFLLAISGVVLLLGAACQGPDLDNTEPVASDSVAVQDNEFEAPVIEVAAGTTVTWTWEGSSPHNVSADGWESDTQESGEYEHTFDSAGTFDYKCTLHGGMKGRVIVTQ